MMETDDKTVTVESVDVDETFIVKTDAGELCRLCANTDNQLIPIFRGEGLEHNLPVKIKTHLPIIKVTEVDKLPLQICYQCASTLISWNNLYEGCRVADKRLREILSIDDKYQEDETYADYVDDYRDDYDEETHESPSAPPPNTSNLASNTLKDVNSTEVSTLSDTKTLETESDRNNERYVASGLASKKAEKKRLQSRYPSMTVAVDPAIVVGSTKRPSRRRSIKLAPVISPKKLPVSSKMVPILPKPEVKAVFVDNSSITPALTVLLGAAMTSVNAAPATTTTDTKRICKLSCDQCGLQFSRKSSLNNHVKSRSCSAIKKWQCDGCDEVFLSRNLLKVHERNAHRNKPKQSIKQVPAEKEKKVEKRKVNCDICSKTFGNKYLLAAHIRRIHQRPVVDDLPLGKKIRKSNVHPERMALYRDRTTLDDDGTAILNCDHCSYRTKCRYRFYEHYLIHTGERPYTCNNCQKTFRTKAYIRKHILTVHEGIKNYPCDICGQAFSDRRFTENHRRIHTGERPYVCDLCGKTYAQSATLMVHKRFHLDERNYECDICGKRFVRRGHLLVHLKRHNQIKDYICEQCGKAFVDRNMLKDHYTVHSQERPFVCDLCGAGFKLKKHLIQHGRTHNKT